MKKLVAFLTVFVLSLYMGWAGSWSWSWNDFYDSSLAGNDYYNGDYTVVRYDWDMAPTRDLQNYINLVFAFYTQKRYTYNSTLVPLKGTYPISKNEYPGYAARYYGGASASGGSWVYNRTLYTCRLYNSSGTLYRPYTGNIVVGEGADGPYIRCTDLVLANADFTSTYSGTNSFYIGSEATYNTVFVNSNNNSMGTVTSSYKSGYVYDDEREHEYKTNSVYTITATPKPGFRFVKWSDGGAQTHDITITGDATYTAYFEAMGGAQYTIIVQTATPDYCTVSGGGTYYEGEEITISSTSKNEHLYIFDLFMLEGEDEDMGEPTFKIQVTKNATYTAHYRLAKNGTVTVNSDHGIVTGGGSYAGGTAVQLGVTANDGYIFTQWSDGNTDNPRTVYVDGDAVYTAQFVQGVEIYAEEGTLQHNSANFTITGTDGDYTVQLNFDDKLTAGLHTYDNMNNNITYSYVLDHGTKLQIRKVSVPVYYYGTNWLAAYVKDVFIETTDGKGYKVTIYTNRINNGDYAYCDYGAATKVGPYANVITDMGEADGPIAQGEGCYLFKFYQFITNIDTYYEEYQGAICVCSESPSIPTGRYPINSTKKSGTVFVGGCDNSDNWYDSWIDVWWREMTGATQRYWATWTMRYGYVDIVNKGDGTYFFDVYAYSASGYPIRFTMGSAPANPLYAVTFNREDGTRIGDVQYLVEGATPSVPAEPTKEASAGFTYSFAGWQSSIDGTVYASDNLPIVGKEDVTYTATYIEIVRRYTIIFQDMEADGGRVWWIGDFAYGATPIYGGTEEPAKESTDEYIYSFIGWTDKMMEYPSGTALPAVTGEATYYAMYNQTVLQYTLAWDVNGGDALTGDYTQGDVEWGTAITAPVDPTKEGYQFVGWVSSITNEVETPLEMPSADLTYTAQWAANTYTVHFDSNHGEAADEMGDQTFTYDVEQALTANGFEWAGHTFQGWATEANGNVVYADQQTVSNLTTENNATVNLYAVWSLDYVTVSFANPDGSELQSYQLNIGDVPAYEGTPVQENEGDEYNYFMYTFAGWIDGDNNSYGASDALPAVTGDITYTAQYNKNLFIVLQEDKDADYYTAFSDKYNGERATTVTLNRQFSQGKWATLCLPFNVNTALISALGMSNRVYEFKYTKGSETEGLTLYFSQAKKIEAGKGYIVNANATMAKKTSFVFPAVVINTEADINSGFDISNLEGYNSQGTVYLVGTLRTGLLLGSQTGSRYMGLKDNKIYYPNTAQGTSVRAYRGIFRNTEDTPVSRVRIVVEGEDGEMVDELEVVNGEIEDAATPKKVILNGILYIERNGELFDAQGKRLE